jgi:hypothetical protein
VTTGHAAATERIATDTIEPTRCSDAARERGEPVIATAPPAGRLLLIELPGPWGRAGLTASRLPVEVTRPLAEAADAAGVRVQLIRRPGRHPSAPGPLAWALADPGRRAVRWGRWTDPDALAGDDVRRALHDPIDPDVAVVGGPQRLVLVCTHAKHDLCCAVRGLPVAAALTAATLDGQLDRQVWETSHLGGDRFAANLLLLPEGEVFGGLDEQTAADVVRSFDRGRIALPHHRGRVGQSPVAQAALRLAAESLGDDRVGAFRLLDVAGGPDWRVRVEHDGRVYRLRLTESLAPPHRLTCAAVQAKPARRFALEQLEAEEQGVAR